MLSYLLLLWCYLHPGDFFRHNNLFDYCLGHCLSDVTAYMLYSVVVGLGYLPWDRLYLPLLPVVDHFTHHWHPFYSLYIFVVEYCAFDRVVDYLRPYIIHWLVSSVNILLPLVWIVAYCLVNWFVGRCVSVVIVFVSSPSTALVQVVVVVVVSPVKHVD